MSRIGNLAKRGGSRLKYEYLQNFRSLDPDAFGALMRHLGFATAVCYRLSGEALVQVLRMESGTSWPAAIEYSFDYNPGTGLPGNFVPLGFVAPSKAPGQAAGWRNLWPKNAVLYFPEQELYGEKLLFAVVNAPGKRHRPGEMSGALEAVAARMRSWYGDQADRHELSEAGLKEHIRSLGIDLHRIVDHELRTPLASVSGYAALLKDVDPVTQADLWKEHWRILEMETVNALEAMDKLSLALHSGVGLTSEMPGSGADELFDGAEIVRQLCEEARARAADVAGEEAARRLSLRFQKSTDQTCDIAGNAQLFRWAVWEVLKNAVSHSRSGKVEVAAYVSGSNLVIDVVDDGVGVSAGSEELIFLRFYQDPGALEKRKGKRGLGLGLFLARHIAERHLGQLTLVRQRGGTMFRFVWPRQERAVLPKGA